MPAQALLFPDWLQEPLEAGCLSSQEAWILEWELLVLAEEPWSPGVFALKQRVALFHWEVEGRPQ